MTAAQITISAQPTWRYWDDAPPVRPPSRKRRLGAILAYAIGTAGVGAAIFWPRADQALAFSSFKIPPSPFAATAAAAPPQPSSPAAPTSKQPTVATSRALPNPTARLLPHQSTQGAPSMIPVSQSSAVATPNPSIAQQPVTTAPQPATTPPASNQPTTQSPWRDHKHRIRSHSRDSAATQSQPSSTPQTSSAPTTDSTPPTTSGAALASAPSTAQSEG
jgi:hypothetical protein